MTRTTSAKRNAGLCLAVFGYEINRNRTLLIVFAIAAAFCTTVILALSDVIVYNPIIQLLGGMGTGAGLQNSHPIAATAVFLLASIFTIVYTVRGFSYLHNKRKADRANPLPIPSGLLFLSKALAAFAAAVVPALFFIGIICLITVISGASVNPEVLSLLTQIPMGSVACIAFYGLMAVCCGNTVNTVLSFLAICFAYPVSAFLIKGIVESFFIGLPSAITETHFVMKALNPLAAYDGLNTIYWILFTPGCFALSLWLLRRRKAENAQTSFAFRLPCYIVEVLLTFIAGMLLGVTFGSFSVLGDAFGGFVFGFVLGGATAFVVAHVILFRGFQRILKSLICFGAVTVLAIGFTAICCFASDSYALYLPAEEEITGAGYIDLSPDILSAGAFRDIPQTVAKSAEDFTDEESIHTIRHAHENIVKALRRQSTSSKFGAVSGRSLIGFFDSIMSDRGSYSVAYTLKNGSVVTRVYDVDLVSSLSVLMIPDYGDDETYDLYNTFSYTFPINSIEQTPTYVQKYDFISLITAEDLADIDVSVGDCNYVVGDQTHSRADMEKLFEAFRKDHFTKVDPDAYGYYSLNLQLKNSDTKGNTVVRSQLLSVYAGSSFMYDFHIYAIASDYDNTFRVLEEIGILEKDRFANRKSPYLTDNSPIYSGDVPMGEYSDNEHLMKGEVMYLRCGWTEVPWDCIQRYGNDKYALYEEEDHDLLMFQSTSMEAMPLAPKQVEGAEEQNAYADKFNILEVLTADNKKINEEHGVYGTAKVSADGKEETLRFIQFGDGEFNEIFFFTDKVSDEDYNSMVESYRDNSYIEY